LSIIKCKRMKSILKWRKLCLFLCLPIITMSHFIQSVDNKSCKHTLNTQTEDIQTDHFEQHEINYQICINSIFSIKKDVKTIQNTCRSVAARNISLILYKQKYCQIFCSIFHKPLLLIISCRFQLIKRPFTT
jgi:hypothetical protein